MEGQSRAVPAVVFALSTLFLLLHHWYVVTEGRVFMFVIVFVPMIAGLALGGLLYPPILWSVGPRGRDFPWWTKALGLLFALSGIAVALFLAKIVYGM